MSSAFHHTCLSPFPLLMVTWPQRDIMENGFPLERHEGRTDAVFLDLPGPWKVVANAAKCLKPNGRSGLHLSEGCSIAVEVAQLSWFTQQW